jgi:8-oxo-dGTP pyrophosphatase MutT (NUDIX family)
MPHRFERRLRAVLAGRAPDRVPIDDARAAAVLVPIYNGAEPTIIFTVRTENLPSHKGQISFPGGSIDAADPSPAAAALREAHEELGLHPAAVTLLGELDAVPTFVSGYVIHPFVGWVGGSPELRPNSAEVAEVLEVPVSGLVEDIRAAPGFVHKGRTFPTEAWIYDDHVIWGATARIVRVLLHRLAEAGLAESPGELPGWPSWAEPATGPST